MNPPVFKKRNVVYRRVAELLIPSVIFSFVITILNMTGLVVKRSNVVFMIAAFVVIYTIFNFTNLRKCYFDLCNKKRFYLLNFLSHAIFACINFAVLMSSENAVYTWLFSITKGLKFLDIDIIYSVLLFHFIQLICIVVSPIGMGWVFYRDDVDEEQSEFVL